MDKISISVIVPVYNVEKYLEDCLDSILQQDFQDYEIICVNDASTDNSKSILLEYAEKYNKIKVITHSKNKGLSASRNTGLLYAKGKYIMFVDSDDIIVRNTFVELYSSAEKAQVDIVYFNIDWIYENENDIKVDIKSRNYCEYNGVYSGKELFCLFVDSHQVKVEAYRQFIRKDFLEENKINFYEGILHEDILFSYLCAMNAQKVIDINKEYYFQRNRQGSITHTRNYKRVESMFVIMVQILTYWNSHVFSDRENRAMEYYFRDLYNSYKCYSWFENREVDTELKVGGYVEKVLYSILQKEHKNRWLTLNQEQLCQIEKAKSVIIFGAGVAAMDIINILNKKHIKVDAIAVSNTHNNPKLFCGIQVYAIDDIVNNKKDAIVIIGVSDKYSKEVKKKLECLGYKDIVIADKIASIYSNEK
ncbi:MAG: glycosyltransferase [Lachnospiraceae bacterium]|nr:glycosyltransferase [Lachnospiraceae bacterium]